MIDDRHLVLVGLMGTGKTTTARLLAHKLDRQLVDSDQLIESQTGRTVREIFLDDGEAAFRALETSALRDALAQQTPLVIAAAGGVVKSADNRAALVASGAVVVWLDASLDILTARTASAGHRPLLDDDPAAALAGMATERRDWYDEVSTMRIDTTDLTPEQVSETIIAGAST
ncbi:MAG: shikimate kinase [Desertimonas sp.]